MIPGALYDISGHITQARVVLDCLMNALPEVEEDPERRIFLDRALYLATTVSDVLVLAARDAEEIERQLNKAG